MTQENAKKLALELEFYLKKRCTKVETIKVSDSMSHYRIEITPAEGGSIISHLGRIFQFVEYHELIAFIDAKNDIPCINIY